MFLYHANQMWWVDADIGRSFPKDAVPKEGGFNTDKFVELMNRKGSAKSPQKKEIGYSLVMGKKTLK